MLTRVDGNQGCIIDDLQLLGCTVQDLSGVGHGCPDIVVGYHGVNYLLEIKVGKNKLQRNQEIWHEVWGGQVSVIRNLEEAMELLGIKTNQG